MEVRYGKVPAPHPENLFSVVFASLELKGTVWVEIWCILLSGNTFHIQFIFPSLWLWSLNFPVYEKANVHHTSPSLCHLVISDMAHCAGKKVICHCRLFFQVVECCHYFSKQTGAHETALVTLLTGQKTHVSGGGTRDEATKSFSSLGVAKAAGDNGLWLILLPLSMHAIAGIVLVSVLKLELI